MSAIITERPLPRLEGELPEGLTREDLVVPPIHNHSQAKRLAELAFGPTGRAVDTGAGPRRYLVGRRSRSGLDVLGGGSSWRAAFRDAHDHGHYDVSAFRARVTMTPDLQFMNGKTRNRPCGCGSGRKQKRCCGLRSDLTPESDPE